MAFDAAQLTQINSANGYGLYRYDTLDLQSEVETAGYFNNSDDNQRLATGDIIMSFTWTTVVRTGTLNEAKPLVVSSVAAGGAVSVIDIWPTS